jgi:GH24 family phage-related lysozyme (muramidase)
MTSSSGSFGFGADFSSRADLVAAAQNRINALGYTPPLLNKGKPGGDGIWGPKTAAAVVWAQKKLGVTESGLGPLTLKALGIGAPDVVTKPTGPGPAPATSSGLVANPADFASLVAFAKKFGQTITQASGIAPGFQATKASVINSFVDWSSPLEGFEDFPYTDAEGLVTVGLGDLIDAVGPGQQMHVNCGHGTNVPCGQSTPTAVARGLPWQGGSIDADWAKLKSAWPGTQSTACKGITSARLTKEAVQSLVSNRLKANEAYFLSRLPGFAQAPADAQLALHSMAWAMGPAFAGTWPQFDAAFKSGDYATAAAQSHMQGVGIDMRNLANKLLLLNAAAVAHLGVDPDHLYYIDGLSLLGQVSHLAAHVPNPLDIAVAMNKWVLDVGLVAGFTVFGGLVAGPIGFLAGMLIGGVVDIVRRAKG